MMADRDAMRRLDGGRFVMGSDRHYPEEAPARAVRVDPFWIDETPVTNAQFARFVAATGHVTLAEHAPDPRDYPGMDPAMARAGSLVFTRTAQPVDLGDPGQWWDFRFGADWRHPLGPESSIDGLEDHPVVHVAYNDAQAYADWAGKALPTEAEWEYAARGELAGRRYPWGDALLGEDGGWRCNVWQGVFPARNDLDDGWLTTAPVRSYAPNGLGLWQMIGNVWEWCGDWFDPTYYARSPGENPHGPDRGAQRSLRGGSYLCHPSYCNRYRNAARSSNTPDSSAGNIGFRTVAV